MRRDRLYPERLGVSDLARLRAEHEDEEARWEALREEGPPPELELKEVEDAQPDDER